MWEVRKLEQGDGKAAESVEKSCFPDPWKTEELDEMLGNSLDTGISIWENEIIAGYCLLRVVAGEGELFRIGVKPEFRKKGLGRKLMDAMEDTARKKQAESIYLEVRAGNLPAISLYKSRGFSETGRRKHYYSSPTEDAVLMELRLI